MPNRDGSATTSSTGTPSTVTPTARRSVARASRRSSAATRTRRARAPDRRPQQTTANSKDVSAQRRGSPATSPVERRRDLLEQRARAVEGHPLPLRRALALESRSSNRRSVCGPMPETDVSRPARAASRNSSARRDAERAPDLDHPLRADAEEAAEPDELRPHLLLELVELRDAARLDELAQAPGDARPDPAQLLDRGRTATSSATGAFVSRIVSAARRYARDV